MSTFTWLMVGLGGLCLDLTSPRVHPRLVGRLAADTSPAGVRGPPKRRRVVARVVRRDSAAAVLAAVRVLSSELATGARPAHALAAAAAIDDLHRDVFHRAAEAQRQGGDAACVLRSSPDTAFVGHAWAVAAATGAPPAEVLARAASDCADRVELRRAVSTALSGARASAGVMAALPLLGVGLGSAMGARPVATLFGTPAGRMCAVLGVLLDLAGIAWTQCIARRAMRP